MDHPAYPAYPATPQPASGTLPLLEVIVTTVEDGLAAFRGGADRLEVVSNMDAGGLLPDPTLVQRLRDAVTIPLRVMLRQRPDFFAGPARSPFLPAGHHARETPKAPDTPHTLDTPHTPNALAQPDLDSLCRAAEALRAAGADQFVLGFLDRHAGLDLAAIHAVLAAARPAAWTFHRAFDDAAHPSGPEPSQSAHRTFAACAALPGLDAILSAGSPQGIDAGLATLCARAAWQTPHLRWLAGGGLRPEHVAPLRSAGITHVHTGRAVRRHHRWDGPVDPTLVRQLKAALTRPVP